MGGRLVGAFYFNWNPSEGPHINFLRTTPRDWPTLPTRIGKVLLETVIGGSYWSFQSESMEFSRP